MAVECSTGERCDAAITAVGEATIGAREHTLRVECAHVLSGRLSQ